VQRLKEPVSQNWGRTETIARLFVAELPSVTRRSNVRRLYAGDFNRSMQHLNSSVRAEDVAYEAETEDLLQLRAEELDVGSLASR
jgi:hypothetical protein